MKLRVFVIEDDADYAELLQFQLHRLPDVEATWFSSGEEALHHFQSPPDLVFLDIILPHLNGLDVLKQIRQQHPEVPVVIVSAQTNVHVALEAMHLGAYDYITKGHDDIVKVRTLTMHVGERVRLSREVTSLRAQLPARHGLEQVVGESAAMARVFLLIKKVLRGDLTVTILGESGTGKELVAQAIHHNSHRRHGPFVVVNCAAIPRDLMESEFFGHEKGSFTGAHARKIGKFEMADGGTLFLDEIGELNLDLQAKLLRALQQREVQRVGGHETIRFDARILAATNRDIQEMVREGTFREDLYYRLFQFPIHLPPLRERDQDILLLAEHLRQTFSQKYPALPVRPFAPATRRLMMRYPWPGNVRELGNAIERALLISDTPEILPEDLMLGDLAMATEKATVPVATPIMQEASPIPNPILPTSAEDIIPLEEAKQQLILHAYQLCEGNIDKTAKKLDVSRSTIYRILRKIGENV